MVGPLQQGDGEWSAEKTKLHVPSREMELCKCSMRRRRASRLLDLRAVSGSTRAKSIRAKNCEAIINECVEEVKGFGGMLEYWNGGVMGKRTRPQLNSPSAPVK
jgi:hypothetical protein